MFLENGINVDIVINDQKIVYFSSLNIVQSFNAHHQFELVLNQDVIEDTVGFKIEQSKNWIGTTFTVTLNNGAMSFKGIVCEVNLSQSHGLRGDLIIRGSSPTIILDAGGQINSFSETTLSSIANDLTKGAAQDLDCQINPAYSNNITYITQFKESNFSFLNRLSAEYGEFFFYDGRTLHFGKPEQSKEVALVHGQNLNTMNMCLRIKPLKFSYYSYNSKENANLDTTGPAAVNGLNEFAQYGEEQSKVIYDKAIRVPIKPRVNTKAEIDELAAKHAAAAAADLSEITGQSTCVSLNIGSKATVSVSRKDPLGSFNQSALGNFLITKITHHIDGVGHYTNNFTGISVEAEVIPVANVSSPQAETQIGNVVDNNDPQQLGRVKVQLLWQVNEQTTDWIRILSPNAGSSGQVSKNRGHVFVPEIGDQVVVGFRYNDPDRPFVMGSIFNGESAAGGKYDNHLKSISTRTGHLIEFDDTEGKESITITDKNQNVIRLDTNASSIEISAPEGISIRAKNIDIAAAENITISAGENISMTAGDNISTSAGQDHMVLAENITMIANDTISKDASRIEKTADHVEVNALKDNIELHSSKQIINKSGSNVKLF